MGNMMTKLGGVGWILLLVAPIISIIGTLAFASSLGDISLEQLKAPSGTLLYLILVNWTLMGIGLLFVGFGGWGLKSISGHPMPLIAGIFGLVTGILYLVSMVLLLAGVTAGLTIAGLNGWIIAGVFFILIGVSLVLAPIREKTGAPSLTLAAGILAIIQGAMHLSLLGLLIAPFFLIPVAILNLIAFFKA
ncbi:hypothetical protein HYS54_04065 [Candidatus Micrarchaeota archaeon]|nr:hypothetical protein [Candidatus Micrarchaeota archaeon]